MANQPPLPPHVSFLSNTEPLSPSPGFVKSKWDGWMQSASPELSGEEEAHNLPFLPIRPSSFPLGPIPRVVWLSAVFQIWCTCAPLRGPPCIWQLPSLCCKIGQQLGQDASPLQGPACVKTRSAGTPTPETGRNGQAWVHSGTQSFPDQETCGPLRPPAEGWMKEERPDLCPWSSLPSSFVVRENWAPPQGCGDSPCPWGVPHPLAREDMSASCSQDQLCGTKMGERRH